MSTKKPIPRRRRFNVSVEEMFQTKFTVLAMTQEEAEAIATSMAEDNKFPHDAESSCERQVNAWKGKA